MEFIGRVYLQKLIKRMYLIQILMVILNNKSLYIYKYYLALLS